MEIKGYKVFYSNWTCRGKLYKVGETYTEDVTPIECKVGMHFCKELKDCFSYYPFTPQNKVAEVVALGEISEGENKFATNKLRIVRELSWEEVLKLANEGTGNAGFNNTGDSNTGSHNAGSRNVGNRNDGDFNTGDYNEGDGNTGDFNTGNRNAGDSNAGDFNTGTRNTGTRNSGIDNTGNRNTGNRNTGDFNTGDFNTGDFNTGNRNAGSFNTGDYNKGNFNTGDFNLTDNNTGYFNTKQHTIYIFDVDSKLTKEQWKETEAYHLLSLVPTPDGDTSVSKYHFQTWWDELSDSQRNSIRNIPNFNAEKFKLITGIDTTK